LACGLPVVTTPVGDNESLVGPSRRGFIVPTGRSDALCEAMEAALQTEWNRESIARFGADYSWDEAARRTIRFFQEQMGIHPRGLDPISEQVRKS